MKRVERFRPTANVYGIGHALGNTLAKLELRAAREVETGGSSIGYVNVVMTGLSMIAAVELELIGNDAAEYDKRELFAQGVGDGRASRRAYEA